MRMMTTNRYITQESGATFPAMLFTIFPSTGDIFKMSSNIRAKNLHVDIDIENVSTLWGRTIQPNYSD